ncbi:MAG: hypothetical protein IE913_04965 [Halothiobacillus sp.]|nr:hypothetical protein [Halothiobacillus sp.]
MFLVHWPGWQSQKSVILGADSIRSGIKDSCPSTKHWFSMINSSTERYESDRISRLNSLLGTSKNLLNAKLATARDPIAALGGANAKLASARYGFFEVPCCSRSTAIPLAQWLKSAH